MHTPRSARARAELEARRAEEPRGARRPRRPPSPTRSLRARRAAGGRAATPRPTSPKSPTPPLASEAGELKPASERAEEAQWHRAALKSPSQDSLDDGVRRAPRLPRAARVPVAQASATQCPPAFARHVGSIAHAFDQVSSVPLAARGQLRRDRNPVAACAAAKGRSLLGAKAEPVEVLGKLRLAQVNLGEEQVLPCNLSRGLPGGALRPASETSSSDGRRPSPARSGL